MRKVALFRIVVNCKLSIAPHQMTRTKLEASTVFVFSKTVGGLEYTVSLFSTVSTSLWRSPGITDIEKELSIMEQHNGALKPHRVAPFTRRQQKKKQRK